MPITGRGGRRPVIGVMGPGDGASAPIRTLARTLGQGIAQRGWVLLTGGRNVGVMEEASQGAREAGGLVIGVLPDADGHRISDAVDVAIFSDLGNARNNVNTLSSDVVIACGMGAGTASEVALAIKNRRPTILLEASDAAIRFFQELSPTIQIAQDASQALAWAENVLQD